MRIVLLVVCILSFNVAGQAILGINVSLPRLVFGLALIQVSGVLICKL